MNTILGKKVGMTQIFSEAGAAVPVTVIEAGPVVVTQVKTAQTDGYEAVQIGYVDEKAHRVTNPMKGHFEKAGVDPKKYLSEVEFGKLCREKGLVASEVDEWEKWFEEHPNAVDEE